MKRLLFVFLLLTNFIYSQDKQAIEPGFSHWISISGGYQFSDFQGIEGYSGKKIPFEFSYMMRYHFNKSFFISFKPGFYFMATNETIGGDAVYSEDSTQLLPTSISNFTTNYKGFLLATHSPIIFNFSKNSFTFNSGFDFIYPFGRYSSRGTYNATLNNGETFEEKSKSIRQYDEFRLLAIMGFNISISKKDELGLKTSIRLNNMPLVSAANQRELSFQLKYNHRL